MVAGRREWIVGWLFQWENFFLGFPACYYPKNMEYNGYKISFHVRFGARVVLCVEWILHHVKILLSLSWYVFAATQLPFQGLGQREDCLGILGNDWSHPCLPKLMPFLFPKKQLASTFCVVILVYLRTRERRKGVKNPFKELRHLFLSFREIREKRHKSGISSLSFLTYKQDIV